MESWILPKIRIYPFIYCKKMTDCQALVLIPFLPENSSELREGLAIFPHYQQMHLERMKSSLSARFALLQAFQKIGQTVGWKDLASMSHDRLPHLKEFYFSLSHTLSKDGNGVAGAFLVKGPCPVGLDLEWASREMKEGATDYFTRSEDKGPYSQLEMWCLKEAAFKASSSLFPASLILKDLWIDQNYFGHHQNLQKPLGHLQLEYTEQFGAKLMIGQAHLI